MKYKIIFTFIFILCIIPNAFGETPGEIAQRAEEAYLSGNYQKALKNWEDLLSLGLNNGNLYYNIGSTYWRLGEVGKARLYFLKAKNISPRDSFIRDNLAFIEEKLGETTERGGFVGFLGKIPWWHLSLNQPEALKWSSVFIFLFFGYLLLTRIRKKKLFLPLSILLILLTLFSGSQLVYRLGIKIFKKQAVVVSRDAALLKAPTTEIDSIELLKEGTLLNLRKKQGKFWLVKSASGKEGWVTGGKVERIL